MPDHAQENDQESNRSRGQGRSGSVGSGSELTRRTVVAGTGMLAAAAALTACSSYGEQEAAPAATGGYPVDPTPGAPPASGGAGLAASTSDIPVGGGAVFEDEQVVVTQPTSGEFRAFSATCTHQGCLVNEVANGTIDCPCHGSKFDITDGSPVDGPATTPLAAREVVVEGDSIQVT